MNTLPAMFHPGGAIMKVVYCLLLSFIGCAAALLGALSKNDEGGYNFLSSYIPFMAEVLKLLMASWLLIMDPEDADKSIVFCASVSARYMILAFFYAVQNNILYYTLKYIDVATFQVAINLKIPLIAVLMYFIANKHFDKQQIIGLVLLVFGSTMVQFNRAPAKQVIDAPNASFLGIVLLSCMIIIPSFASVFNELMLKQKNLGSIHWQNIQLYFFGCIFTFIKLFLDLSEHPGKPFQGFNIFAWLSIVNLGFLGLITSAVLKHADNILRSFSSVGSVFLAIYFSWLFLGKQITFYFFIGAAITCISILVYTETFKWHDVAKYKIFSSSRGFERLARKLPTGTAESELVNTRVVENV